MIAACPKCSTRYRVDPEKLGTDGARLRCTQCEAVFRVRAPKDPGASASEVAPTPVATAATAPTAPAGQAPEGLPEGAVAVLVADPSIETGKSTAAAIEGWGLHPLLVHDGVEAILAVQRNLPAVAVLDAALPKMFGFQVCEMIKRNDSLRDIKIVLIGAIHHADRYRRPPSDLYGADAYLEHPDLPHALEPLLQGFGLSTAAQTPDASASEPAPVSLAPPPEPIVAQPPPEAAEVPAAFEPAPEPSPARAPAPPAASDDPLAEERSKAERLARIIVSDIVLYQPEKFEAAARAGNLAQALESDLAEGRTLFNQRIDQSVRDEGDFLMKELERVAAEHSG